MKMRNQLHAFVAVFQGESSHGTDSTGGWVGSGTGLDAVKKRLIS
jgi:hypothetical protein